MKNFKILSFDGGGIKGALSTRILSRVCKKYPELLDDINLFTGTSTGAIIALALAYSKDPYAVDNLYNSYNTKKIFSKKRPNLFRPKFSNKNLLNALQSYFPSDLTLKDLNPYIFIPSFSTKGFTSNSWEPVFFNNLSDNPTANFSVIDAALSSSAAPTYFPSHKGFIDGGVVVNNPTPIASFFALSKLDCISNSSELRILSIGTGTFPTTIKSNTSNWGMLQWAYDPFIMVKSPILSILLEGSSLVEDIYCKELFRQNYYRLNPNLPKYIEIDDYKQVDLLKEIADSLDLTDLYKYIDDIFYR
ncbi:MAG: patatin-like phospholipase family protein [Peptostreptococcaceae bacterium]